MTGRPVRRSWYGACTSLDSKFCIDGRGALSFVKARRLEFGLLSQVQSPLRTKLKSGDST